MSWTELGDLDPLIHRALVEDLGAGDVTSRAVVPPDASARGRIVAKAPLVFCGGEVLGRVFAALDARSEVAVMVAEGAEVAAEEVLARVDGNARALLAGERTALNLLGRMCGIATLTRAHVEAAGGGCRILDTRKTMPGLRLLDRYAVRMGGGRNHRNDLSSGVLIKENHIVAAGGIENAIRRARDRVPHTLRVECEVRSLEELASALDAGVDAVLLDNMDDDSIAEAVRRNGGRVQLEVSGGVTLQRVATLAALGVDFVSVGALTHSVKAADISMLLETDVGSPGA